MLLVIQLALFTQICLQLIAACLQDSTDLRFFTSLMIIAAIRDQRFAGFAVDCICGQVIDVYTHMAAIRKACSLGALPEDALEELFHRSTQNKYREGRLLFPML